MGGQVCGGVAVTMWGQAALAAGAGVVLLGYWQLMLHLHASAGAADSLFTRLGC